LVTSNHPRKEQDKVKLEAGNRHNKEIWLEHIHLDSRRQTQGSAKVDLDSGELFNFQKVDNMPDIDSDDNGNNPGLLFKPAKIGFRNSALGKLPYFIVSMFYIASISEKTVI
jgi:hypothetical protein